MNNNHPPSSNMMNNNPSSSSSNTNNTNNTLTNTTLSPLNTPSLATINFSSPNIKKEILLMIAGYLHSEGYHTSAHSLLEECQAFQKTNSSKHSLIEQLCSELRDGNWNQVDFLLQSDLQNTLSKNIIYLIYKQWYFELIEGGEYQKAFSILNKKIKNLKSLITKEEFSDLCVLLTCKNVNEVERFSEYNSYNNQYGNVNYGNNSREGLIQQIMLENSQFNSNFNSTSTNGTIGTTNTASPENRLIELLNQAINFQTIKNNLNLNSLQNNLQNNFNIVTLLKDYQLLKIPNNLHGVLSGHLENVKAISFIGQLGLYLASASSDHQIKIWDTINRNLILNLNGHENRIWDLSNSKYGNLLASASSDGTIKIWDVKNLIKQNNLNNNNNLQNNLQNNYKLSIEVNGSGDSYNSSTAINRKKSDLYCVEFDPNNGSSNSSGSNYGGGGLGEQYIACGGYDHTICYYDLNRSDVVLRRFEGHSASVCCLAFSPGINTGTTNTASSSSAGGGSSTSGGGLLGGSIIASGSKDKTIKLWDLRSHHHHSSHHSDGGSSDGDCILTIHLGGEVTGLQMNESGDKLLSCSKDNLNRLWDVRKIGDNNSSSTSGAGATGGGHHVLQKYKGHQNAYKNFIRCGFGGQNESVVMSGSEDGYVYLWDTMSGQLVQKLGSSQSGGSGGSSGGDYSGSVFDVAFNASQGLIATAAEDAKVRLFNYDPNKKSTTTTY